MLYFGRQKVLETNFKTKLYMLKEIPSCKRFNGYKPCYPAHDCWKDGCKDNLPIGTKILIINLDAMGDVLMTTAQLVSLKRKFPQSTIHWVTLKVAAPLLLYNEFVDQVFVYDAESISILSQMKYDYVMNVDKSQRSCALLNIVNAPHKRGFGLNEDGKIIPVNEGSSYNYELGMNNHLKFKINKRTGQEYLAETFEVEYSRNDYVFNFSDEELKFIDEYKKSVGIKPGDKIIGFNTGCSELFPNKKMTIEQHVYLINRLLKNNVYKVALLGGPEDTVRNEEIYSHFKGRIINTPTTNGVRKGACYEAVPDIIITGDSFGMHLAIALQKYVIAWFGLSCWTEIDLYDRGVKLFQNDLECSPCWKKQCPYSLECINLIDLDRIISEVDNYFQKSNKIINKQVQ